MGCKTGDPCGTNATDGQATAMATASGMPSVGKYSLLILESRKKKKKQTRTVSPTTLDIHMLLNMRLTESEKLSSGIGVPRDTLGEILLLWFTVKWTEAVV